MRSGVRCKKIRTPAVKKRSRGRSRLLPLLLLLSPLFLCRQPSTSSSSSSSASSSPCWSCCRSERTATLRVSVRAAPQRRASRHHTHKWVNEEADGDGKTRAAAATNESALHTLACTWSHARTREHVCLVPLVASFFLSFFCFFCTTFGVTARLYSEEARAHLVKTVCLWRNKPMTCL